MTGLLSSLAEDLAVEHGHSMSELYPRLLAKVLEHGERVAPRGRPTLELSPFIFQLDVPRDSLVLQQERHLNRAYATVEKLALVAGIEDPSMYCFYIDRMREFVNPANESFDGCYGPRVAAQLPYVYELLRSDPDSRRAVIAIYGQIDQRDSLDVPCTLTLQFLLRRGELSLIVNMRSSDVYLGLPYDVNQFCFLQQVVAFWLGARLGKYVHLSGSGHVYESDIDAARRVMHSPGELLEARDDTKFGIRFEGTSAALSAFFEVERDLRSGALGVAAISTLDSCLQPAAALLRSFCRRRLVRGSSLDR